MMLQKIDELRAHIEGKLPPKRFAHVLSVEREIEWLGEALLSHELLRLKIAALLHDNTKDVPDCDQAALCDRLGIQLTEDERACPPILHAKSGAFMAKTAYGDYVDGAIVSAIARHTTASPDMTLFDRLLFMADFAEKGRKWERCQQIRAELHQMPQAATKSEKMTFFNRVFLHCLSLKAEYITQSNLPADKQTIAALSAFTRRFGHI